jgi:hypothetical protein
MVGGIAKCSHVTTIGSGILELCARHSILEGINGAQFELRPQKRI